MVLKSVLAVLLLLGVIRADTNIQEEVEICEISNVSNLASLANEQMSQRPGCVCPAGQTLVNPRHSSFLPPYCSTILRSDAVQCKLGWSGVCISDSIEQRATCQFPEVLEMSCAGYGHDSQLIFHEGQFRCLLTGQTPKQCGDVCPSGFSPRCIQLRCLKAFQPEPIEIIVEVPVTVTKRSTATATTTTTIASGTVTTTIASGTETTTIASGTETITNTVTSGTVTDTITSTVTSGSTTITITSTITSGTITDTTTITLTSGTVTTTSFATTTTTTTTTTTRRPCHKPCRKPCRKPCHCGRNPCRRHRCPRCGMDPCQCNNGPAQPFANAPFKADLDLEETSAQDSEQRSGGMSPREGRNKTPTVAGQCLPFPLNRILGY